MDTQKVLNLIENIIGKNVLNRRKRGDLRALIDMILSNRNYETVKENSIEDKSPNELGKKTNDIDLQNVPEFRFPTDLNLEVEGMAGIRRIKIMPDGVSES